MKGLVNRLSLLGKIRKKNLKGKRKPSGFVRQVPAEEVAARRQCGQPCQMLR